MKINENEKNEYVQYPTLAVIENHVHTETVMHP